MVTDNQTIAGCFWIMPETTAIDLSLATNAVGAPAFPGITPTGGTLAGLPVFASEYMETTTHGSVVMLVKGSDIFLADEGGIQVAMSDQATIDIDDGQGSANNVSMFQNNAVAFLVERFINFAKRRTSAVVWGSVDWDQCA